MCVGVLVREFERERKREGERERGGEGERGRESIRWRTTSLSLCRDGVGYEVEAVRQGSDVETLNM